jgi:hypothetical protein
MTEAKEPVSQEIEDWAYRYPSNEARLIREHMKVIPGYDLEKVLKGQIIERIIGDDTNTFNSANLAFSMRHPDANMAELNRKSLLRRMRWELDQPLTPNKIRGIIEDIKEHIEASPWETKDDILKAHAYWEEEVRTPIRQMLEVNEEGLKDAQEQYNKFFDEISARGLPH